MVRVARLFVLFLVLLTPVVSAAASDATIFRLFLTDGTALVSYGEYARLQDQVIFSMPAGGSPEQPRLVVVSVPSSTIDWPRTDRYAASARYQRYAETQGEEDFHLLSNEVARLLNDIALSTDRPRALEIAQQARRTLADWPRSHYGYRQNDVREIVALLDEAISGLSASRSSAFDLSLVADTPAVALEPVLGMPTPREQLDQLMRLAATTTRPAERVALLQSALALLADSAATIPLADATRLKETAERQIRDEIDTDRRYAQLTQRLSGDATRAAERARPGDVERVLARVTQEDDRLGRKRADTVQALRASIEAKLNAARQLRLLRDQWVVRRGIYRDYQRSVGSQILQLVSLEPSLEAIRRLEGPSPDRLATLRSKLSGGAERLQRLRTPVTVQAVHDLLVSAWRFAEQAANTRFAAIASGNVTTAWEASSAAAGAILMLTRAQQEIRALVEPPRLQ